jgi:hypothetical protein
MIEPYRISFHAMGSQFNVWLETEADGETVLRQVPGWVEAIEARLTRFRPESELSRLNGRRPSCRLAHGRTVQPAGAARSGRCRV